MTTSANAVSTKDAEAFRTISEVAESLKVPQHVLRFWETRFVQIKPMKRAGNRRFYRPQDVELVGAIRQLLYGDGYTIKGVQRILREQGPRAVAALARHPSLAGVTSGPDRVVEAALGHEGLLPAPSGETLLTLLRDVRADLAACRKILADVGARAAR